MLRLFTPHGLEPVRQDILLSGDTEKLVLDSHVSIFLRRFQWYADTVETAIGCLRHVNSTTAWPTGGRDCFPPL